MFEKLGIWCNPYAQQVLHAGSFFEVCLVCPSFDWLQSWACFQGFDPWGANLIAITLALK
jgi:hypothetical protein